VPWTEEAGDLCRILTEEVGEFLTLRREYGSNVNSDAVNTNFEIGIGWILVLIIYIGVLRY
jgi:hypothetical protein